MKIELVLISLTSMNALMSRKSKIRKFPEDFWFGAVSAAYQIEGAWLEDGKGKLIWDMVTHLDPSPIKDESTGDVAADSYHLYERDVEMVKELHLDFYRFSISWPRILPEGLPSKINKPGLDYYNNLITEVLRQNITPIVTMYHWDLPQSLQRLGGWANPLIKDYFVDYAKILFDHFGDRVKYWFTMNDPKQICVDGYGMDTKAPQVNMSGIAEYMCTKNILLAHAEVYHIYDEQYRKLQQGLVGIAIGFMWFEPASETVEDHEAAFDANQFDWGLYAHPIFSTIGDYPLEVKRNIASKSAEQGFPRSRLPELSIAEVKLIKGTADFLGVNSYTTKLAYRDASLEGMYPVPSYLDDMGAVIVKDSVWVQSKSDWLQDVPWGFFKVLVEIKTQYDNPPVYITENGWSSNEGLLDEMRIQYHRGYLNALLDAIDQGCDLRGYTVRSLMDSFEWLNGYVEKFGLYEVDFSSSEKTRTPRKSAFVYKEIARSKVLDPDYEPESFIVEVPSQQKEKEVDSEYSPPDE